MKLLQIKQAIAAYLEKSPDDLYVNSVDLILVAMNQVRQQAELLHDFEFSRKLVAVAVNSVTGGSLEDAVFWGTEVAAPVKTVINVGLRDTQGSLNPVRWATVADSLLTQTLEGSYPIPRYPTDGQAVSGIGGVSRFLFSGSQITLFPVAAEDRDFNLGIEAYVFTNDWTEADLNADDEAIGAPWTTVGSQYIMYAAICQLNNIVKHFVYRQEGNVAPPTKEAEGGLDALIRWDIFKYDQFRAHSRR